MVGFVGALVVVGTVVVSSVSVVSDTVVVSGATVVGSVELSSSSNSTMVVLTVVLFNFLRVGLAVTAGPGSSLAGGLLEVARPLGSSLAGFLVVGATEVGADLVVTLLVVTLGGCCLFTLITPAFAWFQVMKSTANTKTTCTVTRILQKVAKIGGDDVQIVSK